MLALTAAAALGLALALALAGCGEKEEGTTAAADRDRVGIVLDYFPNADHAGLYAALAGGEFDRARLDVDVRVPDNPASPLKLLAAGKVDLAISYEPELLLAREKGLDLVSVGAIVQKPLTSIMALGSQRVRTPKDLAGNRVGTAGIPYQAAYLDTILETAGVPRSRVKVTNVGFNLVPAMLSRKVDATLGAFWNYEGVQLEQKGKKPSIIRMEQVGVPTYNELIVVARRDSLSAQGNAVRRFMQALARGYESLKTDPGAAVDALVEANPDLDRKLQRASIEATLPVFFPADKSKPFGYQDPGEWDAYGRWMLAHGLLQRDPNASAVLTNEFLPGEGLRTGPAS